MDDKASINLKMRKKQIESEQMESLPGRMANGETKRMRE